MKKTTKISKLLERLRPEGYRGGIRDLFLKISRIGFINTIRFNRHYFGWKSVFRPIALLSREVKLRCMKGIVMVECKATIGLLTIGLNAHGMVPWGKDVWENNGTIVLKGRCHFGPGSRILNSGVLQIGGKEGDVRFNGNVALICYHKMDIGPETTISWDSLIMDTDFHKIYRLSDNVLLNENKPVSIGKHCWIGCRSLILKGASIPNNSIIAAGSVVTKSLSDENVIYASNAPIKQGVRWER